ncbi:hypothetical protein (macronuclear) [Paramecium tetraurelia strain d4-2]|uniref:PX domain-containing protein n=1 Tax=Paramecium tetraurelia TaxID=5888 RepID=Q6BFB5_PARTE|nr:hypothetical protein [Paramecium tetraurelia strain d4-2]CAH03656.1 hypothetical protein, PX-domain, transmembrane helices [Paramecium tetraurelia]
MTRVNQSFSSIVLKYFREITNINEIHNIFLLIQLYIQWQSISIIFGKTSLQLLWGLLLFYRIWLVWPGRGRIKVRTHAFKDRLLSCQVKIQGKEKYFHSEFMFNLHKNSNLEYVYTFVNIANSHQHLISFRVCSVLLTSYVLIIIIEFCQIINYLLAGLQVFEDADIYGQTTFVTQLNLIVFYGISIQLQFLCFCGFAIILFTWQINNKDRFVIMHEDTSCWLMFILRGIVLMLFSVFVFFMPQDKKLLQTIVSEYKYKKQLLGNDEETQIRQQLLTNESTFTFCQPDIEKQSQVTDIEVKSFQDNKDLNSQRKYIIYEITFKYQNKHKIVFRSFSDFLTFHRDLALTYPQIQLPHFPQMTKYLTPQDIENRREQLGVFLQRISSQFNGNDILLDFLNATGKCFQYKPKIPLPQQQQQRPKKIATQQQYTKAKSIQSLIPETIWEGQNDEDEESIEVDTRKTKKASTYVKMHFGEEEPQYQRFNSANDLDEDQRTFDFEKPSDGII